MASAATPLISLVGPDEWNLPVVKSLNLFLQSGFAQNNTSIYDSNGNEHSIPGSHVYGGVTRFAHLFSFESMPEVGFGVEYLQPYLDVQLPGQSITGLADPLFELGVYFRPAPRFTIGYLNLPTIPVGSNELSEHFWSDISAIIWNYHIGQFGFNGTLAYGVASTKHSGGKDTDIGDLYGAEVTALYELTSWVSPFIGFVAHHTDSAHDSSTGATAPGAAFLYNCLFPGGCSEQMFGGGLDFHIPSKHHLSIWYYSGISGSNVVKTNAAYLFYTHPF